MNSDTDRYVLAALTMLSDMERRPEAHQYLMAHSGEALPVLISALEGPDERTAALAAEVLGSMHDQDALAASLSPLGRQALYGPPAVAVAAVAAMASLPVSRTTVLTLEEALGSEHAVVRVEAALGLARMSAQGTAVLSRRAASALSALAPADVRGALLASLWRLDPTARAVLVPAAFSIDVSEALAALREGMTQRHTATDATEVLTGTGTVRALSALLTPETAAKVAPALAIGGKALAEEDVRGPEASKALEAAVAALLEALYTVREPIARAPLLAALQAFGGRGQQLLAARLADEHPARVGQLAEVLAEVGWRPTPDRAGARYWIARGRWDDALVAGPEAIGPLVEAFLASGGERRAAAARALEHLNWAPTEDRLLVPYLVALGRWTAIEALGERAVPRLGEELAAERSEALRRGHAGQGDSARLRLIDLLAKNGSDAAGPHLAAALELDPSSAVRLAALRGLLQHGPLDGALLARCLQAEMPNAQMPDAPGRERSATLRSELVAALGAADGPGAVDLLVRQVREDTDEGTRSAAVGALGALCAQQPDEVLAATIQLIDSGEGSLLGELIVRLERPLAGRLAEQLGDAAPARSSQAVAALVALGRQGGDVDVTLRPVLLGGTAVARLGAARVYDRLDATPTQRDVQAAYWLAKGRLDRCLALGEVSVAVLAEALPRYEWRTAAAMAVALLRLRPDPEPSGIDGMVERLREVATLPNQQISAPPPVGDGEPGPRPEPVVVSHDEERRAARAYLEAIADLRKAAAR